MLKVGDIVINSPISYLVVEKIHTSFFSRERTVDFTLYSTLSDGREISSSYRGISEKTIESVAITKF